MKKFLPLYILLFTIFLFSCSSITKEKDKLDTMINDFEQAKTENKEDEELQNQIQEIAAAAKGRVGVTATVLETGEFIALNETDHFPMQSVYKFPIAMAVLKQVDDGKLKLDQKIRIEKSDFVRAGMRSPIRDKHPNGVELSLSEIIRFAVSESDGTASDVLMRVAGGAEPIQSYLKSLSISEIIVANTEKEIGQDWETQYRNWASPEESVALLRALHEKRGISEKSQELLIKFMTETSTGPKRLKGLLPKEAVVVHKTGTSGTNEKNITAATNDIGIIKMPNGKHLALAVYVSDSPADETTREEVIAKIAKTLWDKWGK